MVKALLYRAATYRFTRKRKPLKRTSSQLEEEIASSKEPAKAILQSIAAHQYWMWVSATSLAIIQPQRETVNFKERRSCHLEHRRFS